MGNRNELGRFTGKSAQPRQVRSVRATDDVWNRLNSYADQQGVSVADLLEKWVYSLPVRTESTNDFYIHLWQAFEAVARSEVGESIYGHPVRLKVLFAGFQMSWDDFLTQVGSVADSDGSLELIPLRGQNYQIGHRRVAAITYHL